MATPVEQVRENFAARARRDVDAAVAMFAPDVALHLPDPFPFADVDGVPRLLAIVEDALERTNGTYAPHLLDVVGAGNVVVALVRVTATSSAGQVAYHQ